MDDKQSWFWGLAIAIPAGLAQAAYHGIRGALGMGPTLEQTKRECDAEGLDYSPASLAKARAYILSHPDLS